MTMTALVVEPNPTLRLYSYLLDTYSLHRVSTVEKALVELTTFTPDLLLLSTSYSTTRSLRMLEALKYVSVSSLIPLIFVVDLNHRMITFPGTTWAGKVGILHSFSSRAEVMAAVERLGRK